LDRDGTVIKHLHHLIQPADVALIPGAAAAIARLREAGFLCVIVTNQSVVGRRMIDLAGLGRVHERLHELLAEEGTALDGLYFCTELPRGQDQTRIEHPDRKPGPGMLLRAAEELGLDLAASWMIGDSLSDVCAGKYAGCRESLLVLTGNGRRTHQAAPNDWRAVATIAEAATLILEETRSENR
jgi:D-glycero-D-manno-heptose 1,7-bisphosphate phosphatase